MSSILDKYGIKEVADVTFHEINEDGSRGKPVLVLDTLKVSTIEQNAEVTHATGGKGNAQLIAWDYGKEITVTLEDALFSAKSLAIMFGNGKVVEEDTKISKTLSIRAEENEKAIDKWKDNNGVEHAIISPSFTNAVGEEIQATAIKKGEIYFITFDIEVAASTVTISSDTFPGTYYVVGDTFARSEASSKDEFFQFVIPKAKVTSENTITLEAEGDPSVFSMNLSVLRPQNNEMMKLIKYNLKEATTPVTP